LTERHANARKVLRWLAATGLAEVSVKDIRRDLFCHRLDEQQTRNLLDGLVRAGWLRQQVTRRNGPGRPTIRWEVNPLLLTARGKPEASESLPSASPDVCGSGETEQEPDDPAPSPTNGTVCDQCKGRTPPLLPEGDIYLHPECKVYREIRRPELGPDSDSLDDFF
jgi:hypothetical protein